MYHKSDLDYDITKLQEDNGYEDLYLYCIREDGTNIFSLRNALEFKNPTLASYIRVNKHFYVIKILDRNLNIERIKIDTDKIKNLAKREDFLDNTVEELFKELGIPLKYAQRNF